MTDSIKNLMFDLAGNKEIFDSETDRVISKAEANDVLRKYCFEELGLSKDSTDRQIKRAFETPEGRRFFQVIEEICDLEVTTGWYDSEFFQNFVETKVKTDGDRNDFWTQEDIILTVSQVSGDHHDFL